MRRDHDDGKTTATESMSTTTDGVEMKATAMATEKDGDTDLDRETGQMAREQPRRSKQKGKIIIKTQTKAERCPADDAEAFHKISQKILIGKGDPNPGVKGAGAKRQKAREEDIARRTTVDGHLIGDIETEMIESQMPKGNSAIQETGIGHLGYQRNTLRSLVGMTCKLP